MKLQPKANVGIVLIFTLLAVGMAIASVTWVNRNTIQAAESRVRLYIRSSWDVYNSKIDRLHAAAAVLAEEPRVVGLLSAPTSEGDRNALRRSLEAARAGQGIDILNLLDAGGQVVMRTRSPYNEGDQLTGDLFIDQMMSTGAPSKGTILFSQDRLKQEGEGLLARSLAFGGMPQGMIVGAAVPVVADGRMVGIIQVGSLLNGANEKVDRIRDAVFENQQYKGKPLGTATLFMGDLRVSTNVIDQNGNRAVGTRASAEVVEQVLRRGLPWTGRAWVVDAWYLAQYDPIRNPNGDVIGMLYVGELEQKYLDARAQALTLFLSVLLAGMAVAFLVFFLIMRGILGPLKQLSLATQRLSSGDLSYRVVVHTRDEVGDLAQSFNEMTGQLEEQRRQIEQDRRELAALNEELRTTNRNYMELLGFVAHELMNPLSSAMLSLDTVKDGYLGPVSAAQRRSLESVATSLDYFRDMIRNYLDLSRLEKGELKAARGRVALISEVVAPVLEGLGRSMQVRGMAVENKISPDMVVLGDRDLLRIVYDNLLSNAVKYGQEGGRIILDASDGAGQATLSVTNEGAGIPPDKVTMLFKKFSRLDNPEYAGKKGTGLGLYICKEIVERQGGRIWAESEPGRWARFVFTIPEPTKEGQ